jgi:hypothetical protein
MNTHIFLLSHYRINNNQSPLLLWMNESFIHTLSFSIFNFRLKILNSMEWIIEKDIHYSMKGVNSSWSVVLTWLLLYSLVNHTSFNIVITIAHTHVVFVCCIVVNYWCRSSTVSITNRKSSLAQLHHCNTEWSSLSTTLFRNFK